MVTKTEDQPAQEPAENRREGQGRKTPDGKEKPEWQRRAEDFLKLPADRMWYATMGATAVAAIGLLLPWIWIDDHAAAHSMADLITFYPSHDDKWYLMRTTPLGTLTVLVAPMFTALFVLTNAIKAIINEPSTSLAVAGLITGLSLALFTGEITDPDRARIGTVAVPLAGMCLTMLGNLTCIGLNTWTYTRHRRSREGEAYGRSGFEW